MLPFSLFQQRRSVIPKLGAFATALVLNLAGTLHATSSVPESGPTLDLRYRYEYVDDAAFTRDANANTLRLQLGYRWVFASNWQAYIQGERVQSLFGESYNDTVNGKVQYPVVADPESTEINQAYLGYSADNVGVLIGRQAVMLDNQRFFGNVNWRQNEQTFDAASAKYTFSTGTKFHYIYLNQVLRTAGHDHPNSLQRAWDLNGHLFNVNQTLPVGALTGYGYFVENKDISILSTRTLGVRWTGKQPVADTVFGWALEYADQADWGNNLLNASARYWLIEPTLTWRDITLKAGWEVMGGDGQYGFSTPYATLHAFDGWADRLTTTPVNGIDDRYFGVSSAMGKVNWIAVWHGFRANRGNLDYGHELDASLSYPLYKNTTGLVTYADYRSDGFSVDEKKFWASVEYKF